MTTDMKPNVDFRIALLGLPVTLNDFFCNRFKLDPKLTALADARSVCVLVCLDNKMRTADCVLSTHIHGSISR